MLLGHLLILLLPLVSLVLEGLYLAFKVTGFYVSLAKPRHAVVSLLLQRVDLISLCEGYMLLTSHLSHEESYRLARPPPRAAEVFVVGSHYAYHVACSRRPTSSGL